MYRHILVTTNGTDIDHAAVRHAAELARTLGARLTLLHIIPDAHLELSSGNDLSVSAESIERDWKNDGERALQAGLEDAACSRLTLLQRPARGRDIPHAILEEAGALGADLMVMATHGRKGLSHLLLGSVADRVVHDAAVPILLIRQGASPV